MISGSRAIGGKFRPTRSAQGKRWVLFAKGGDYTPFYEIRDESSIGRMMAP